MPQVVLGTAGHIDHGKTSLVKALTGFNTDRLIEEKDRGMTIDLGFAYLNDSITIIDVPGHEKFIRNMTAGAANIHYGLIVVAADDGVMPQTIEHLDILTLLGVNKGWVAITKIDVVKDLEWIDLVEIEIQECLTSRGFKSLSINRINNLNGDGIQQLKSDIENIIDDVKPYDRSEYFRMNVDRVFSKTGFGTVATGTVSSHQPTFTEAFAMTVVLASEGYPGPPRKGLPISVETAMVANEHGGAFIHHAGTKYEADDILVSSGGRVLACTGIGQSLDEARNLAYSLMDGIILEGSHYRSDIGFRAL